MPNKTQIETSIRIGKSGITENVVKQVISILKKKKIAKVKFLPSAIMGNKKELFKELAEKTRSKIIHKVGFIVILEKVK